VVQLGRFGDLINIFPILKKIKDDSGFVPEVVVHRDFASVLDGISYAKPVIWDGAINDPHGAAKLCTGKRVIITQIDGNKNISRSHECFAHKSWDIAGCYHLWGTLPYVFDRRNPDRERILASSCLSKEKKNILVATQAYSSPFKNSDDLLRDIRSEFPCFNVVDLGSVKAQKIYDMLGLYERSVCLITVDTSHIHLSAATRIPIVLLRPETWVGFRSPNPRCFLEVPLENYTDSRVKIIDAVRSIVCPPKIIHVYSDYKISAVDADRMSSAMKTWGVAKANDLNWFTLALKDEEMPRLFDDKIRKIPFVKDLINAACSIAGDDDIIMLTNRDIEVIPFIGDKIRRFMLKGDACSASRRDYHKRDCNDDPSRFSMHCGSDLFAFKKQWWTAFGHEFTDFLMAAEQWDLCFNKLIEMHSMVPFFNFTELIFHKEHDALWGKPSNINTLPSQVHNRKMAKLFDDEHKNYKPSQERIGFYMRCNLAENPDATKPHEFA